jgi:hypothetical protein
MHKKQELSDPHSYLNRATDYELLFVLLARDPCAPHAIRAWATERCRLGLNEPTDPQILEATALATGMQAQRHAAFGPGS